jgi:hypothetical protein
MPDLHPAGHVVSVPPAQLDGSHVTSQAHDDAQVTPLRQVWPPTHWTLHACEPQVMTPKHEPPARQLTRHDDASRQETLLQTLLF